MNGFQRALAHISRGFLAAILAVSVKGCDDCQVAHAVEAGKSASSIASQSSKGSSKESSWPDIGKAMTITGEPMCPACFLEAGSKSVGPGHFQCAVDCERSGQTLAIYDRKNDRIYHVAGKLQGQDPNAPLRAYVHKNVDVTGRVFYRAGAYGIVIAKVELHKESDSLSAAHPDTLGSRP